MDRNQTDSGPSTSGTVVRVGMTLFLLVVLYFLPLLVVAIDEGVLRTFWIDHHFPKSARDVFYFVYPFLHRHP